MLHILYAEMSGVIEIYVEYGIPMLDHYLFIHELTFMNTNKCMYICNQHFQMYRDIHVYIHKSHTYICI
jgi:hypothetical protein